MRWTATTQSRLSSPVYRTEGPVIETINGSQECPRSLLVLLDLSTSERRPCVCCTPLHQRGAALLSRGDLGVAPRRGSFWMLFGANCNYLTLVCFIDLAPIHLLLLCYSRMAC